MPYASENLKGRQTHPRADRSREHQGRAHHRPRHGILKPSAGNTRLPGLGSLLWLIPGHCDPTVNLHDMMIGVRGGLLKGIVESIIKVDARGALT